MRERNRERCRERERNEETHSDIQAYRGAAELMRTEVAKASMIWNSGLRAIFRFRSSERGGFPCGRWGSLLGMILNSPTSCAGMVDGGGGMLALSLLQKLLEASEVLNFPKREYVGALG